jgi:hypothetical protein
VAKNGKYLMINQNYDDFNRKKISLMPLFIRELRKYWKYIKRERSGLWDIRFK